MASRVYISVFGSGLGHASRMALLAEKLRTEDVLIKFSSSFEAIDYLKNRGFECNEVPGIDVPWGSFGTFAGLNQSLQKIPSWTRTFMKQIKSEIGNIRSFRPNLVLSDTRLSAAATAWLMGIPFFTVINQLRILFPSDHTSMLEPFLKMISVDRLTQIWCLSESIFIPDLPPPYTISERNVWAVKSAGQKIRYTGFITPKWHADTCIMNKIRDDLNLKDGRPVIVAQISGPTPTKKPLIEVVRKAAREEGYRYSFVITEGIPGGRTDPVKVGRGWQYEWCPYKDELLYLADVVIARGGHSTIGQLITLGKPMIIVPILDHSEQIGNASKVEKLGIGKMIEQSRLTIESLSKNLSAVINDSRYIERAAKLKKVALNYNGAKNINDILMQFIRR